jgi:hypothetical protein
MGRKKQQITEMEQNEFLELIENHILTTGRLCSLNEISETADKPIHSCKRILDGLLQDKRLRICYEGKGKPTLYIPNDMFEEILIRQSKPAWIRQYFFDEKVRKLEALENLNKDIHHFEIIESLLYCTGQPLEEAVAHSMNLLGFHNVQHHRNGDMHDVSFEYKEKKYVLEVEGTAKQANKQKVTQLNGWMQKEVDDGTDPGKLRGILVINHFRKKDPVERREPLTEHAKKYLKLYNFNFFTTFFLFNTIREVIEQKSLSKKDAMNKIVGGEKYL